MVAALGAYSSIAFGCRELGDLSRSSAQVHSNIRGGRCSARRARQRVANLMTFGFLGLWLLFSPRRVRFSVFGHYDVYLLEVRFLNRFRNFESWVWSIRAHLVAPPCGCAPSRLLVFGLWFLLVFLVLAMDHLRLRLAVPGHLSHPLGFVTLFVRLGNRCVRLGV